MDIYKNIKLSHIQQGKFHNVWHKKQKEPIIKKAQSLKTKSELTKMLELTKKLKQLL